MMLRCKTVGTSPRGLPRMVLLITLNHSGLAAAAPLIELAYGDSQSFGQLGHPQRWVNLIGRVVSDAVLSRLVYSFSGGPEQPLAFGPDNFRLVAPGEFNLELDRTLLTPGATTVTITATDSNGQTATRTVTVNYTPGKIWPLPYTADWDTLADGQVVDGFWERSPQGLHSLQSGYDRTVALGDETWSTDYEVVMPFTLHTDYSGVGFAIGWQGHEGTESPRRPRIEWPLQAIAWLRGPRLNSTLEIMTYGGLDRWEVVQAKTQPFVTEPATPYVLKARSESLGANLSRVSVKFWPQANTEPEPWALTADVPSRKGSVLLVAYNTEVTFGTVTVTPLGGGGDPGGGDPGGGNPGGGNLGGGNLGNLAPNPSFESDPGSDYFTRGKGEFGWARDAARTGGASLKIASTRPAGSPGRWLSRGLAAEAGATYRASVWLKSEASERPKALRGSLVLSFWNLKLKRLRSRPAPSRITGTSDWTPLEVSARAPRGTAYLRVEFRRQGPGTLWADDVRVDVLSTPTPRQP